MPIYMDRHDVSDVVTAENVAQLHQQDLKIQDQFGCRGLTYWFDDKRKTAFCLIEAPDMETLQLMHKQAHGEVPNQIIEVEPRIVESFLGRIEDPVKAQNTELNIINDPAFRTLMVIRMVRSFPGRNEYKTFPEVFARLQQSIRNILGAGQGTVVKQSEDECLASFKSVTHAVSTSTDILTLFKEFRNQQPSAELKMSISLNAGVPVTNTSSIFEETIKLAERMSRIVIGQMVVSAEVRELYKSENGNQFVKGKNIISLSTSDEKFITVLMDYMERVWNDANLKADDFLRPTGCSKSQLYRKMIALTGKSPNAFVKEYRLMQALKMFHRGDHNISEIAFETGFSSPSYFSTCFQKHFGYQPSVYLSSSTQ